MLVQSRRPKGKDLIKEGSMSSQDSTESNTPEGLNLKQREVQTLIGKAKYLGGELAPNMHIGDSFSEIVLGLEGIGSSG